MNSVIVLQKPMHKSKTRLNGLLSSDQRIGLAYSMLYDVLKVLSKVPSIDELSIVTSDPDAIQLAKKFGAKLYFEQSVAGMNQAIKTVVDSLDHRVKELLILPGDIPLITVNEVDFIMKQKRRVPVTIFPCKDRTGTNGLILSPPKVIDTAFGTNSIEKHRLNAMKVGCEYLLGTAPLLSYDIDTTMDLYYIEKFGKGTKTYDYIYSQGIIEKLKMKEVVS
ncbi:2-phospho-L-lactate guanylyltransferase [Alkalihalobacterium alkalinitrilicum]|uniref:2-phospho-L-lactate guanylyltransferase n=1 Tax=Alkalihalobacterium alkalinitrilicum TaxID=427920 RepID=UPI001303AE4B|nr:2-phospho-L-lactate guanylyltransferase [Alkalihalobacterium alkalinitrilicum]